MTTQLGTSPPTFAVHPGITFLGMLLIVTALSILGELPIVFFLCGATAWVIFSVLMALFESMRLWSLSPNRQLAERMLRGAMVGVLATLTPFFMLISELRGALAWDVLLRGATEYIILIPGVGCGALAVYASHWYRSKRGGRPSQLWWVLIGAVTAASAFLWAR